MQIILQNIISPEYYSIKKLYNISDNIDLIITDYNNLHLYKSELLNNALPIGSVQFIQKTFELLDINQPTFTTYPVLPDNYYFYNRKITISTVGDFIYNCDKPTFIKPTKIKDFTGFVFKGLNHNLYNTFEKEQLQIFKSYRLNDAILTSTIKHFIAEWRLYIINGNLIASCRYDDNDTEYLVDINFINKLLPHLENKTLTVDIGLSQNGKFSIVEFNDAWAIGKYKDISDKNYLLLLHTRWNEILLNSTQIYEQPIHTPSI